MEFNEDENPSVISQHSSVGLEKRGLLEGGSQVVTPPSESGEKPFRYFYPTTLGVELFLWGLGVGELGVEAYAPTLLKQIELPFNVAPSDVQFDRISWGYR